MESIKVIIENWPATNHFIINYISIVIAIAAVAVSLYSAYLSRKSFIASHRPYVWALNYNVKDPKNMSTPAPYILAYRVNNSPAKIIFSDIKIVIDGEELFSDTIRNFFRFPDDTSEWTYVIGKKQFEQITNGLSQDKSNLRRIISLKYSSISGGDVYSFNLTQTFNPEGNQWKDFKVEAT